MTTSKSRSGCIYKKSGIGDILRMMSRGSRKIRKNPLVRLTAPTAAATTAMSIPAALGARHLMSGPTGTSSKPPKFSPMTITGGGTPPAAKVTKPAPAPAPAPAAKKPAAKRPVAEGVMGAANSVTSPLLAALRGLSPLAASAVSPTAVSKPKAKPVAPAIAAGAATAAGAAGGAIGAASPKKKKAPVVPAAKR